MTSEHCKTRTPRLIVSGGGSAEDERPQLDRFAQWVGGDGRLLYLPVALAGLGRSYESCLAWATAALAPSGISHITMWTDLTAEDHALLDDFDAVFIGGGNTYSLLAQVRASGFDTTLTQFAARGGAIYGGSAGAILLGRDIQTCAHLDRNTVGITDTRGLDLMGGYSIWCHYQPSDDARITEYLAHSASPILALSERAGASLSGGILTACGYEPVYRFTHDGKSTITPGKSIT